MKENLKKIKKKALQSFRSKAMGDVVEEYEKDLVVRLNSMIEIVKF